MLVQMKLGLRLHRFVVFAAVAGLLILTAFVVQMTLHIRDFATTQQCIDEWLNGAGAVLDPTHPATMTDCQRRAVAYFRAIEDAGVLTGPLNVVPVGAGLLAGVALIAGEIEDRTASIAWSLSLSRMRWLAARVLPTALLLAIALGVLGFAAAELQAAKSQADPLATFENWDIRGLVPPGRGLIAFAAALLAGAILGRSLPALISAGVAAVLVVGALTAVQSAWLPSLSRMVANPTQAEVTESVWLGSYQRTASGEFVATDGFVAVAQTGPKSGTDQGDPIYQKLVTGDRYPIVSAIEAGIETGVLLVLLGATAFVVNRRRPT